MSLTKSEFEVLHVLAGTGERLTQRELAHRSSLSVDTVSSVVRTCEKSGLVTDGRLSEKGLRALEPYRVRNAVIMAAGLSSRFVPLSYERPKGMLRVRGEVLIERQIKQLLKRGISDITVVVGYKKEYFFYLAAKYGVKILVNSEFAEKNNSWTLWLARKQLGNTYVCSSDDFFTENPFERYVYKSYYASEYVSGPTDEWCLETDPDDRITGVDVGGRDSWVMLGQVYFDYDFSQRFVPLLEDAVTRPENDGKLWEAIYADNLPSLDMEIRRYPDGVIHEFDSLAELESFDPNFIENVDSEIFDNIVSVLGCSRDEIRDFYPMSQGLTSLSCHFAVGDHEYVYRHPGVGTEKFMNRVAETRANEAARQLGIDRTFIHEDERRGWKICHFVPDARTLDPTDDSQVRRAMELCRQFHESGTRIEETFDFFENGVEYERLLETHGPIDIPGYLELREKVARLNALSASDGYEPCFSHNDYLPLNILFDREGETNVIDWEYAGMSDPGNDFGTFVICSQYDEEQAERALAHYFGREPSFEERRHFWSRVVLGGWCWYVWALEKEAEGAGVGEWLYIYYSYAINHVNRVLSWYEDGADA